MKHELIVLKLLLLFFPFLSSQVLAADSFYVCNGIYQNKPCAKGSLSGQKKLYGLSHYKAPHYIVPLPPVDEPQSPERASLNPLKLNEDNKAIDEDNEVPSGEDFSVRGPEIDRAIAGIQGH